MFLTRWIIFCLAGVALGAGAAIVPAWTEVAGGDVTAIAVSGGAPLAVIAKRRAADPLRSVDGGKTWTAFTMSGTRPDQVAASPTDSRVFYALAGGVAGEPYFSSGPSAFYRSGDGGATWERMSAALTTPAGAPLGNVVVGAMPDLLFASRMDASVCSIGCEYEGAELFVSTDGGRSWRSIDAGLSSSGRLAYPAASDSRVIYATTRAGLYRSADQGASWVLVHASSGAETVYQRQVVVDRRDAAIVYAQFSGGTQRRVTEDGGETWRTSPPVIVPGPSPRLLSDPVDARRAFYVGREGDVFETRDVARTWKRVGANAGTMVYTSPNANDPQLSIAAAGTDRVLFAAAPGRVLTVVLEPESMALGSEMWWNPLEPGRGWAITQHASGQLFVVWYLYDPQTERVPTWRMMSGGSWTDARTFTGKLYSVRGTAFFQQPTFDSSRVAPVEIGTATIRFADDRNATFSYQLIDGTGGLKLINRFDFGPPSESPFQNFADLWWNPDESGWGLSVSHQFGTMFLSWYVYDEQGNPTWLTVPSASHNFVSDGSIGSKSRYEGRVFRNEGGGIFPFPNAGVSPFSRAIDVGVASVTFTGRAEALLTYTVDGNTATKRLNRLPF